MAIMLFGWRDIDSYNAITKYSIQFYPLIIYAIIRFQDLINFTKENLWGFVVPISVCLYCVIMGMGPTFGSISNNLLVPYLTLFWIFDAVVIRQRGDKLIKVFTFLFIVECGLAIYEKLFGVLLFPYSLYNPSDSNGSTMGAYLRSNSLLGHPLTNALVVSTLVFVILYTVNNKVVRYFLCILGVLAILCFEARSSILLMAVILFLNFLLSGELSISQILKKTFYFSLLFVVVYYAIKNLGFGERILEKETGTNDSSTMARVEAANFLLNIDSRSFFKGIGVEQFRSDHIENWILIYVLKYGILVSIAYVYYFVRLIYYVTKNIAGLSGWIVFIAFFVLSLTNNSLACESPAPALFIAYGILLSYEEYKRQLLEENLQYIE